MKSLAEKFRLKPGYKVIMKGAGMKYFPDLQALSLPNANEPTNFIMLWAENSQELSTLFHEMKAWLKQESVFWVAYPKKSSGKPSDLHRDRGWDPLKEAGWRPVSKVSMNDVWTALRFKPGSWPELSSVKARKDLVIPPDMQHFLEKEGFLDAFQALSYTHRKEYIEAFSEAKKPETGQRRLVQLAEKLKARKK